MNKKLRLRISRVISTFKTCRPKNNSSTGAASPPVFHVDFPTPPPPPRPSPSRMMMAAAAAGLVGCRSFSSAPPERSDAAVDAAEDDLSRARETPAYLWRKAEKWHVVNVTNEECGIERRRKKIDLEGDEVEGEEDDDLFPATNIRQRSASRRRRPEIENRRRCCSQKPISHRNSTSSIAGASCFSRDDDEGNDERSEEFNYGDECDDGEDAGTLLSSRSFSTDSSTANKPRSSGAAAVLSRLMPCGADNDQAKVVKESFAVVKRSEDPRADFGRSMAEMVVEKRIYAAADLEQRLNCFLTLNSRRHHRAIFWAFADTWEAIFPLNSHRVDDCT